MIETFLGSLRGKAIAAATIICILSGGSARAATLLVNHDFSDGLNGWETLGTVFSTGEAAVLSDQVSERTAVFQSASIAGGSSTVTVEFDFLNGLSTVIPAGGLPDSMFATVYLGNASFGSDLDAGVFDSAVSLLDLDGSAVSALNGTVSPSAAKGVGWSFFSGSFANSGSNATIAFEFVNDNTALGDSTSAVDNVVLDAGVIPEPSVTLLALVGIVCVGFRRRR